MFLTIPPTHLNKQIFLHYYVAVAEHPYSNPFPLKSMLAVVVRRGIFLCKCLWLLAKIIVYNGWKECNAFVCCFVVVMEKYIPVSSL